MSALGPQLGSGNATCGRGSLRVGDPELPAGATMWRDAEEHSTENVGTTEVRALLFELK